MEHYSAFVMLNGYDLDALRDKAKELQKIEVH